MQWTRIPSGVGGGRGSRNTPRYATETGMTANLIGHLTQMKTLLLLRGCFLPWPLLERMLMQNFSYENELIFNRMNIQETCIFIRIVWYKDLFCQRGKGQLFIHELLTEPLIFKGTQRTTISKSKLFYRDLP